MDDGETLGGGRYPRRSSRMVTTRRVSYAYELELEEEEEESLAPVTRYQDGSSEEDGRRSRKRTVRKRPRQQRSRKAVVEELDDEEEEEVEGTGELNGSDEDEDDLVQCDECGYLIGALSAYFHCLECEASGVSYDLCESCYFETEGASHDHLLDYVRAKPDDKPLCVFSFFL